MRYAAYRGYFTETAWAASLGDIAGFTRHFEDALLRMVAPITARSRVLEHAGC